MRKSRALLWVFLLAFGLRLAAGFALNVDRYGPRGYWLIRQIATNLLEGRGMYWTHYFGIGPLFANRPPLYPLLVAGLEGAFGTLTVPLVVFQSALGAVGAVLVALIARRVGGPTAGTIAGVLAAGYPYFVGNDTTVIEQSLYAVLLFAFVLATLAEPRRRSGRAGLALLAGALGGLATLTRELFLPFFGLALLARLLRRDGAGWAARLGCVALAAGALLAVCAPWLARNAARFGTPALTFSAGKYLWVGNNPHTLDRYPRGSIDASEALAWEHLTSEERSRVLTAGGEPAMDRVFREMAFAHIRDDPGAFLRAGLVKLGALLSPALTPPSRSALKNGVQLAATLALYVLALLGIVPAWRGSRFFVVVAALAFLSVCAVCFAYWGQTRLRAPYDGLLIVFAALALAKVRLRMTRLPFVLLLPLVFCAACDRPAAAPPPAPSGAPSPLAFDFERDAAGAPPAGFTFAKYGGGPPGAWIVRAGDAGRVLAQTDADPDASRFPMAIAEGPPIADLAVKVRARMLTGMEDEAAGLVWRWQDEKVYYLARANVLECNVRFYSVKEGRRFQLADHDVALTAGRWYELGIESAGDRHKVLLDGEVIIEATDSTIREPGRVGLWTKSDSVTEFDDLRIVPR